MPAMKICPHCDAPVASHAYQCPGCKNYLNDLDAVKARANDTTPDYSGYLIGGTVLGAIGLVIGVGSSSQSGAVTGALVTWLGTVLVLVGCIGLGVYTGMRQHTKWLESRAGQ
jgi:hypothetical protein